jgi:predicted transcriptional regulator
VKTFSKAQNRVVRDKLIRARRPCWPTRARWAVVPQQQIATLAGISQALLSNFENGKTDLDTKTLRAVENAIMEVGRHRTVEGFRILADAV